MEKPSSGKSVHPSIADNPKFAPFFNNYIGATDGSLIHAIIPTKKGMSHKTYLLLLILIYSIHMPYVAGKVQRQIKEFVLEDSYNKSFIIPANYFILADAAFTL